MDKKLKQRWVKALESGKFSQGHGYLHQDGKYCCLGVCLRLMYPHSNYLRPSQAQSYMHDRALTEVGFEHEVQEKLALMNDKGKTFKEIAAWIRKHL